MNLAHQKKLQALIEKHLPSATSASHNPLEDMTPESWWEAAFFLMDHLVQENKKLEKDYRTLAIAASESFYSMASQIARNSHNGGYDAG